MNEDIFRNFLNLVPLPILLACTKCDDVNHKVVFANEYFIEQFGWSHEDIVDKNQWWQMAYPDANYRR